MKIGFAGLGRLGLPIAAILSQHHEVIGYDPAPSTPDRLVEGHPWEEGLDPYLGKIKLSAVPPTRVDVVIVAVQTPHHPRLDGTWPDDGTREPFSLEYVETALKAIPPDKTVVLMSTVLPGDTRKLASIGPTIEYAPAFPAMGSTIEDVLDPEFVLIGTETGKGSPVAMEVFRPIHGPAMELPEFCVHTDWETAELIKTGYNTFIGMKLAATNTIAWLAEEVGADGGKAMEVIASAGRRITSPAYMKPGMGDSGACHPRDAIAMSWLAQRHGVYDLFSALMEHRELHSEFIAEQALRAANDYDLPIVILGAEYKPDSTLTDGSPGRLMANQTGWPIVSEPPTEPHVVVLVVPHSRYLNAAFGESVVIDPWGAITAAKAKHVIRPGRPNVVRE